MTPATMTPAMPPAAPTPARLRGRFGVQFTGLRLIGLCVLVQRLRSVGRLWRELGDSGCLGGCPARELGIHFPRQSGSCQEKRRGQARDPSEHEPPPHSFGLPRILRFYYWRARRHVQGVGTTYITYCAGAHLLADGNSLPLTLSCSGSAQRVARPWGRPGTAPSTRRGGSGRPHRDLVEVARRQNR